MACFWGGEGLGSRRNEGERLRDGSGRYDPSLSYWIVEARITD